MKKGSQSGFTLVEVVVVVAVIAILAAVLTPYITKYIDDSRIAKAKNETQVIGAAMANFYKDLGRWPNKTNAGGVYGGVYTGAVANAPTALIINGQAGWPAAGAANWDPLTNHLPQNLRVYPAIPLDPAWKGPYATALPLDPWGRPYMVNAVNFVQPAAPAAPIPVWVLSAGPNGVIDTPINAATTNPLVDDIAFRLM
jgi:prepilin-type N-terminal cleavage/methylation domain-containing protein